MNAEQSNLPLLTQPQLIEVLRRGRDRYNTKFAAARRTYKALSGEALGAHLRIVAEPIMAALAHEVSPVALDKTFDALYDISLELIGKEFFGAQTRYPVLLEGWLKILPAIPRLLADAPRRVAGAVTNALYNLSVQPKARPDFWQAEMLRLAPLCADAAMFLTVGQIAAWRSGLAHYRTGALAAARGLPENVARAALGLGPDAPPVSQSLARLEADLWLDPARMKAAPGTRRWLQVMTAVSGFRGFGGEFLTPPRVAAYDGQIIVSDVENSWLLTADLFGATLHRLGPAITAPKAEKVNKAFTINDAGRIEKGAESVTLRWLAGSNSQAAVDDTLAVTLPLSHSLFLVALLEE